MKQRIWLLDALRGVAIILVVLFHLVFDLSYFHGFDINYSNGFWFIEGRLAAILFISMVGVVSAIIHQEKTAEKSLRLNLWRGQRLIVIAMLITLITNIAFPDDTIWFGILHLMGASILLSIPLLRFKWLNLVLAAFILAGGPILSQITAQSAWQIPFGLTPAGFTSLDYYPLVPWLGVILIGIALGNFSHSWLKRFNKPNKWQAKLAYLGKNSLWIYLIHQPILIGLLWLVFR